jgi:hypothetical protein
MKQRHPTHNTLTLTQPEAPISQGFLYLQYISFQSQSQKNLPKRTAMQPALRSESFAPWFQQAVLCYPPLCLGQKITEPPTEH